MDLSDDEIAKRLASRANSSGPEICNCGRPMDRVHCPDCGSSNIRKRGGFDQVADKPIRRYECRRCGSWFNDLQWGLDFCKGSSARTKPQQKLTAALMDARRAIAKAAVDPESQSETEDIRAEFFKAKESGDDKGRLDALRKLARRTGMG